MLSTGRKKTKYIEKICRNCIHWTKKFQDREYHDLWVGGCDIDETISPYETSDCEEWEE